MQIPSLFHISPSGRSHETLFSGDVHICLTDIGRVKKILSIALDKLPVSLIAVCNSLYLSSILAISCCISKQACLHFRSCELNVLEVHLFLTTYTQCVIYTFFPTILFFFFSPRDRMMLRINIQEQFGIYIPTGIKWRS